MLTKSSNYNSIISGSHYAEVMMIVGEVGETRKIYTEVDIYSLATHQSLYGDYLTIGQAVVGSFEATLFGVSATDIPKMSRVEIWVRLTNGNNTTNWLPKGIFYTRKPSYDPEADRLTISGLDMLYRGEVIPYAMGTTISGWNNVTTRNVAENMATAIGIGLEDSTQVKEYIFPAPPYGYTAREVLQDIALACHGNWMLTYINSGTEVNPVMSPKLRLVSIDYESTADALGRGVISFDKGDSVPSVGYVLIDYGTGDNGEILSKDSGTQGTGREVEYTLESITDGDVIQAIADDLYDTLSNFTVTPFRASGAELDPAYEIGDTVSCNGVTAPLGMIDTQFSRAMYAEVETPGVPEEEDFPYTSRSERKVERDFSTNKASITVNADAITAEVERATGAESDLNTNLRTTISQTAEAINVTLESIQTDLENHATEQRKYIQYDADGLTLGTEGSQTKAVLTDTKLGFTDPSGDEKAYIGQDPSDGVYKFFVINGHIVNQLELGEHWNLVASGSENQNRLTIRWRD